MRLFDYESKSMIDDVDDVKANELIKGGKAVKLDLPELDEYEQKARGIYDKYKADVDRIKNSDNPLFTEEVKKYELDRIEQEYRKQSAEVESEYQSYRKRALEDAKVRAAQATIKVSDDDRITAEQFATRASLTIASADKKGEALKQIANDIALLTDEQKTALQKEIIGVLASVDNEYHVEKQVIIQAVQDIRNSDLLAVKVAEQLPHTVLTMQNMHDIAVKVVESSNALSGGGIDREFYEEYLKAR